MKRRRRPYAQFPDDIASHGFVADLEHEMSRLAKRFRLHLHKFRKNEDWFLAIRVPDRDELAKIDRDTEQPE